MEIQEFVKINRLLLLYESLLTPKQQEIMRYFYAEDFSLGEIAEELGISKQGVHDTIKKCTALLESYEEKLHLSQQEAEISQWMNSFKEALQVLGSKGDEEQQRLCQRLKKECEELLK